MGKTKRLIILKYSLVESDNIFWPLRAKMAYEGQGDKCIVNFCK